MSQVKGLNAHPIVNIPQLDGIVLRAEESVGGYWTETIYYTRISFEDFDTLARDDVPQLDSLVTRSAEE